MDRGVHARVFRLQGSAETRKRTETSEGRSGILHAHRCGSTRTGQASLAQWLVRLIIPRSGIVGSNPTLTTIQIRTTYCQSDIPFLGKFSRQLAIRAVKFDRKLTPHSVRRENTANESQQLEKRVASEGPIRIPLHSLLFLFNALAFPSIPSKSLQFRPVVFSIPTAPTKSPVESVAFASREARIGA